ncbi:hypothetical protein FGADI_6002 [Fusarium gaditjirri]|uniref:Uncharacterized protein n=1 Tax=Fusarium gaditjirri TaxID=282569 RepID=A0A8H4T8U8_9HYPO|nr:hypothetical protein FGADI_6002 [Fusarium gaditjirri]
MSDRGYQDPSKVSDAKALQMLFKSKSGAKVQSNIPKKRAGPSMQAARPAPVTPSGSTTPSTKDRFYTPTLLPNPLERKAGAILGSSASDFLGRRDATPKLSPDIVQGQDHKGGAEVPSNASTVPKAQEVSSNPAQNESEKPVVKLPPTTAVKPEARKPDSNSIQGQSEKAGAPAASTNPPTVSKAPERVSNLDLLCGLATDSRQTFIKVSAAGTADHPQTPAQQINPSGKESKKKSLWELFQNQKSDDESDGDVSDCHAKDVAIPYSRTAEPLKYSPDKLLELKANAKTGVLPPNCIVKRRDNSGKANIAAAYKSATSFITNSTPSISIPQAEMTESITLCPAAPQTSSQQAELDSIQTPTVTRAELAQAEDLITLEEVQVELESEAAEEEPGTAPLDHQPWMSGLMYDLTGLQTSLGPTKLDSIQALAEVKSESMKTKDLAAFKEFQCPQESHELRPQAPGFVPKLLHASSATSMPTQYATPWTIEMDGNEATQHASTSTFCSAGLIMVTATPVAPLSSGLLITGPPTSQLMSKSPFDDTFSTELPLRTINDNEEVVRAPRKPTKGLGASMWAK